MYKGWITAVDERERVFLEGLGITIVDERWNDEDDGDSGVEYEVSMTDKVFTKLEPNWGRFIWGLERSE